MSNKQSRSIPLFNVSPHTHRLPFRFRKTKYKAVASCKDYHIGLRNGHSQN